MIHLPEEFFDGIKLAASRWKEILAMKRMGIVAPTVVDSENILSRGAAHSAYKKLREIKGKGGKVLRQEGKGLDLIPPTIKRRADAMKRFSDKTRSEVGSMWKGVGDIPEKQEFVRGRPGAGSVDMTNPHRNVPKRFQAAASKLQRGDPDSLWRFAQRNFTKKEQKAFEDIKHLKNYSTLHGHDLSVLPKAYTKSFEGSQGPKVRGQIAGMDTLRNTLGTPPKTPVPEQLKPLFTQKKWDAEKAKRWKELQQDSYSVGAEYEGRRYLSSNDPAIRRGLPAAGDLRQTDIASRNTKDYISSEGSKRFSVSKKVDPKRLPPVNTYGASIGMVEKGNPKATSLKSLKTVRNPPKPKLPGTLGVNLNP
jgi:hypothetical protein